LWLIPKLRRKGHWSSWDEEFRYVTLKVREVHLNKGYVEFEVCIKTKFGELVIPNNVHLTVNGMHDAQSVTRTSEVWEGAEAAY
jgi:hypothetical protein